MVYSERSSIFSFWTFPRWRCSKRLLSMRRLACWGCNNRLPFCAHAPVEAVDDGFSSLRNHTRKCDRFLLFNVLSDIFLLCARMSRHFIEEGRKLAPERDD